MSAVAVIVGYTLREALQRRIFAVVLALTAAFLLLFWYGTRRLLDDVGTAPAPPGVDKAVFAGATVLGLAMFATLFLGTVLAVFLTLGVVRGDAERGLLQPLLVRPVGRGTLLLARFAAAAGVCVVYVGAVYGASAAITHANGGWWPDRLVLPGVELAAAVTLVAAVALLGSVFLSANANGIAVFMLVGAGLVAGILSEIGQALASHTLKTIGYVASWITPFEALYQDGLAQLTAETYGPTKFILQLGPAGGAHSGGWRIALWSVAYLLLVGGATLAAFSRRDL